MISQTPSHPDLTGQVAIVTGGASGIGLAIATAFAEQGCHLVLLDHKRALLSEAAERIDGALRRLAFNDEKGGATLCGARHHGRPH
jgi:NAD(P)-dependent dehydrogenase (short-subunit alcohol dehydrogenase family)